MAVTLTLKMSYFDLLPADLLQHMLLYLDIPSLGALSQTSLPKHGNISDLATRDKTWLRITNHRFNLFSARRMASNKISRPKLYGGSNWKDAFRSMSRSGRMPKINVNFKKKAIFAKGFSYKTQNHQFHQHVFNNDMKASKSIHHYKEQFLACFVMINHTENCCLRTSPNAMISDCNSDLDGDTLSEMNYIELQIAFQNTKSGFTTVDIDICNATIQMQTPEGYIAQRAIRRGPLAPKVIYKNSKTSCEYLDDEFNNTISLGPFEFCILSINVPLTYYTNQQESIHFETDFLSRAMSLIVPVTCHIVERNDAMIMDEYEKEGSKKTVLTKNSYQSLSIATFVDEHEIWENYMALPGNCLVLIDKRD